MTEYSEDIRERQGDFKPGDVAKVISLSRAMHGFDVGDIVEIVPDYDPAGCVYALMIRMDEPDFMIGYCDAEHLEKIDPA